MECSKRTSRILYEEIRLLTKDSFEAFSRLKKLCDNNSTHYILINDHIGDVVITLGYIKAFKEKWRLNHVTIIITDKFRDIVGYYINDYIDVKYIDSYALYRIFLINRTMYGRCLLVRKFQNVTLINPADDFFGGFDYVRKYPEISLAAMIKYGSLSLDIESQFIPLSDFATSSNVYTNEKRVVFSKKSRTIIGDADELYNLLGRYFIKEGYSIYTNTEDDSLIVNGSKRIFLKLEELADFVTNGILIGSRSGLHDLLLYYDCTLIAIYFPDNDDTKLFSLKSLPCVKAKFFEIELSDDVKKDFSKIKEYILQGKKN